MAVFFGILWESPTARHQFIRLVDQARLHLNKTVKQFEGSPRIAGSCPGSMIANTWATMMFVGLNGYVESTRAIISTTRWIVKELKAMPHICVVGDALLSVVAFSSKDFNIYLLYDAMSERGWSLSPLQFSLCIHITVTSVHTKNNMAQKFIDNIRASVKEAMKKPHKKVTGTVAIYGTSQAIPDRSIIRDVCTCYLDVCLSASPSENIIIIYLLHANTIQLTI